MSHDGNSLESRLASLLDDVIEIVSTYYLPETEYGQLWKKNFVEKATKAVEDHLDAANKRAIKPKLPPKPRRN